MTSLELSFSVKVLKAVRKKTGRFKNDHFTASLATRCCSLSDSALTLTFSKGFCEVFVFSGCFEQGVKILIFQLGVYYQPEKSVKPVSVFSCKTIIDRVLLILAAKETESWSEGEKRIGGFCFIDKQLQLCYLTFHNYDYLCSPDYFWILGLKSNL